MPSWDYPVLCTEHGRPIIVEVRDGDTFRAVLDTGVFGAVHPWLRIADVYCPELAEEGGAEATAFLRSVLAGASTIDVHIRGRSFARWVADVVVDGSDLAEMIVAEGHGTAKKPE